MTPHVMYPVHEASQVGEVRRAALRLGAELGFDDVTAGRAALVATELGTNLARHAQQGSLLLGAGLWHGAGGAGDAASIDILSLDHGPGMADVNRCLQDGFSTGGTPGTGLGAVQRLADHFGVFSLPGRGTVVATRIVVRAAGDVPYRPPPRFELGALCTAIHGENVSGDGFSFQGTGARARLMVADGLGHGPSAGEASDAALKVFTAASDGPADTLERAHGLLRSTRGAAVAVAHLDAEAGTVLFAGAGNVVGRLISGVEDRTLMSQHGTIGVQIRRLQDVPYAWPDHAVLVMHSDGIITRWSLADADGLLQSDPLVIAGWILRDHHRGRDDATVVVVRRR